MADFAELDQLSTPDLHRRAVKAAEHRHDIKFFWRLLEYIPEAAALSGNVERADYDIQHVSGQLRDFAERGGKLDDALRPVYIDYLEHHTEPDGG